jgi:hypothetical protein
MQQGAMGVRAKEQKELGSGKKKKVRREGDSIKGEKEQRSVVGREGRLMIYKAPRPKLSKNSHAYSIHNIPFFTTYIQVIFML